MRIVPSCEDCNSTMEEVYCSSCGGSGEGYTSSESRCSTCGGSGLTGDYYCFMCEEEDY